MHLTLSSSVQRKDISGEGGTVFRFGPSESVHSEEFEEDFPLVTYSLSAQSADSGVGWLHKNLRTSDSLSQFTNDPSLVEIGGCRVHYYYFQIYVQIFIGSLYCEKVQIELDKSLSDHNLNVWLHLQHQNIDSKVLRSDDHDGIFFLGPPHLQLVQRKVP